MSSLQSPDETRVHKGEVLRRICGAWPDLVRAPEDARYRCCRVVVVHEVELGRDRQANKSEHTAAPRPEPLATRKPAESTAPMSRRRDNERVLIPVS